MMTTDSEPPVGPDAAPMPASVRTVAARAIMAGLVTLAAVLALTGLSHPGADAHVRLVLAESSGCAGMLWVAAHGAATLPGGPRRRPGVLACTGIVVVAAAAFWLLGHLVVRV